MRLLDDQGKQIGIVSHDEARRMAQESGLDLVEIAGQASPPVVKLIDFKKFLYQLKKKRQEEKKNAKTSETKQIQFGPFIDEHDLDIKLKKAREFIKDGDKVRFVVKFRGREITKKNLGEEVIRSAIEKMSDLARVEREAHMEGRQMVAVITKGTGKKEDVKENNVTQANSEATRASEPNTTL